MIDGEFIIRDACSVVQYYLDNKKIKLGSRQKLLLRKLLEATVERLDLNNENTFPIKLTTQELYTTQYQENKDISGWHTGIEEQIKKDEEILIHLARENNCKYYFSIDKDKGGNGAPSFYYLTAIPIPSKKYTLPKGAIEYVPDEIRISFLFRWLDGFTIIGWRKWLFGVVVLIIVIVMVFSIALINPVYYESGYHWLQGAFFFSFVAGGIYVFFRPFRLAIDNRISEAPWILLPLDTIYGQLESTRDDNNDRFFRIIVYKSTCPICNSRIDVRSGGKIYPQRMIGCCRLSPAEHIFSFDPETKIGLPLNRELRIILEHQK